MKFQNRSISDQEDLYYLPEVFSKLPQTKTTYQINTSTLGKSTKSSILSHINQTTLTPRIPDDTSNTQNDYFPNFIKPKLPSKVSFQLKKLKTQTFPNKVSIQSESSSALLLAASKKKRTISKDNYEESSELEEDRPKGSMIDVRSKSTQNIFENLQKSPKHNKFQESIFATFDSDSKKGLKEKLLEYHLIKKYRKQSFLNLAINPSSPFHAGASKKTIIRKKSIATEILIDPLAFIKMKKYKLAKSIITGLKLKEERYIFEEKKIKSDAKAEELLIVFYKENPIFSIYELPELINQAIFYYKSPEEFVQKMVKIMEKTFETKDRELIVYVCKLYAKITSFYGEFLKSLGIYKQCLQDCEKFDLLRIKMSIYKRIGRIYLLMQNVDKSKNSFMKMLHLSLILKCPKYEILAYDYLGLIYYYKCDIKKAIYFHTRMIKGQLEGEHSLLRDVAFTKLSTKKKLNRNKNHLNIDNVNCSSSSEHDSNFFDIKSEDIEYNEVINYKKKFVERRKKTELSKMIQNNKGRIAEEIKYNTQVNKLNVIPNSKFFSKAEINIPIKNMKEKMSQTLKNRNNSNDNKGFFNLMSQKNNEKKSNEIIKKSFFLCHLSSNRGLNTFMCNSKNPDSYNMSHKATSVKIFLNKSDENKIVNCLLFFKKNIFLAINTIKKMVDINPDSNISHLTAKRDGRKRRKAILME